MNACRSEILWKRSKWCLDSWCHGAPPSSRAICSQELGASKRVYGLPWPRSRWGPQNLPANGTRPLVVANVGVESREDRQQLSTSKEKLWKRVAFESQEFCHSLEAIKASR